MGNALRRAPLLLAAAIGAVLMLPAVAQAAVVTLSQNEGGSGIIFTAGDPSIHPADVYPSTITGPAGTVNDVNASVQESHANPDDLDVALVSPNGTAVHLFSDACGADADFQTLRFDDDASVGFLSNPGPCDQSLTYSPSNFDGDPGAGVETDIYSPPGPDGATTLNALSFFDGGPSGGSWRLFGMDDATGNGGSITSWSLTLDFTPPEPEPEPEPPATPVTPAPPVTPPADAPQPKCKKKKPKGKASAKKKGCKKKKKR